MPDHDEPEFSPVDPELVGDEPDDPESGEVPSGSGRGLIPDGVKKAILAGVGALFMTEESARRLARDWKLPKEVIGFIGQQAQSAKDEVMRVFAEEVRRFLQSDTMRRELGRVLESMALEVHAEIRLKPAADGTSKPEAKVSVTPKRAKKAKK